MDTRGSLLNSFIDIRILKSKAKNISWHFTKYHVASIYEAENKGASSPFVELAREEFMDKRDDGSDQAVCH